MPDTAGVVHMLHIMALRKGLIMTVFVGSTATNQKEHKELKE